VEVGFGWVGGVFVGLVLWEVVVGVGVVCGG